jgi:integrase
VYYKGTHGFRHTHAVLLLESGVSLVFASKRLGHKTIKTTADTYLDITKKIEEDEPKKFASYTKRKILNYYISDHTPCTKYDLNRHE